MGCLVKRGRRWYAQFLLDGRKKQIALGLSDKGQARRLLSRLEKAVEQGSWHPFKNSLREFKEPVPRVESLEEQVDLFLQSRSLLRPRTQKVYRHILSLFVAERVGLSEFISTRSPVTQRTYLRHLKVFYRWTIAQGWRSRNPVDDLVLPRTPRKEAVYFSREEVSQIAENIRSEARERESGYLPGMVLFVCQTGLRLGEVCAAKWDWLEGDQLLLRCSNEFTTKSGRDERVFLTEDALRILNQLPRRTDRIFVAPSPPQVSRRFSHWCRKAGLKRGSFHSLRHTCAAWMAMSGASAYVIKRHLRHSSITVTERYMHLTPENLSAQVIAALSSDTGKLIDSA